MWSYRTISTEKFIITLHCWKRRDFFRTLTSSKQHHVFKFICGIFWSCAMTSQAMQSIGAQILKVDLTLRATNYSLQSCVTSHTLTIISNINKQLGFFNPPSHSKDIAVIIFTFLSDSFFCQSQRVYGLHKQVQESHSCDCYHMDPPFLSHFSHIIGSFSVVAWIVLSPFPGFCFLWCGVASTVLY